MNAENILNVVGAVMALEGELPRGGGKGGLGRSPRPVMVMLWLLKDGPLTQGELSARVGCSYNAVQGMVRLLGDGGWVAVRRDMARRRVVVRLTDWGADELRAKLGLGDGETVGLLNGETIGWGGGAWNPSILDPQS